MDNSVANQIFATVFRKSIRRIVGVAVYGAILGMFPGGEDASVDEARAVDDAPAPADGVLSVLSLIGELRASLADRKSVV